MECFLEGGTEDLNSDEKEDIITEKNVYNQLKRAEFIRMESLGGDWFNESPITAFGILFRNNYFYTNCTKLLSCLK